MRDEKISLLGSRFDNRLGSLNHLFLFVESMCGFIGLMCAIVAQGAIIVRDEGTEEARTYSAAAERAAEISSEQAKEDSMLVQIPGSQPIDLCAEGA